MSDVSVNVCPLCGNAGEKQAVFGPNEWVYRLCGTCRLVFMESASLPFPEAEKQRYLKHENTADNSGYIKSLNRAVEPAMAFLKAGGAGLDYGCGPGPVLAKLLESRGFACDNYDPFFFPAIDKTRAYDFIFATETLEHFFNPAVEIRRMFSLLQKGGHLAVMTKLWKDTGSFKDWSYARDFTHVVFYHADTFKWISSRFEAAIVYENSEDVVILQK